jgi:hypothetical protein
MSRPITGAMFWKPKIPSGSLSTTYFSLSASWPSVLNPAATSISPLSSAS